MVGAVHADADGGGEFPAGKRRSLDQDAGDFRLSEQEFVRPFQLEPRGRKPHASVEYGVIERKCCDKTDLRARGGGRGIDDQQGRIEIAGLRYPFAPTPSAAGTLTLGDDEERATLTGVQTLKRLRIGRANRLKGVDRNAARLRRKYLHQNNDLAA